MSEIVDRVAQSLCLGMYGHTQYSKLHADSKEELRISARAAIEAMREPTEAMVRAAGGPCVNLERADNPLYEPQLVWEDMIDEALKD